MRYFLKLYILLILIAAIKSSVWSQENMTQTLRGNVVDKERQTPLPGVNLIIINSQPQRGTISDENGYFRFYNVPVG
ncbi:MAG: carboxypeptidase-like regulatory domain-containing protein, partial [Bacteroidota bacterium]|nr:carboxypeptidase-like regulatory domain-containing protein [Bacteroidota bacterium]